MPRGRPRNNPVQETPPEEQALREQTSPVEPELEGPGAEQTGTGETPTQEEQALREQTSPAEPELEGPGAEQTASTVDQAVTDEPRQQESPETLLGYMAENFREDIRSFMQNFGIDGHPPESVFDAIKGIADQIHGEHSAAETHAGQQEQVPAPDQQQAETPAEAPIPLGVRINSLEMDGDTRAFAAAEYGDLTINRIRVKQDEYGTLSVAMPKFRQTGGWKETCSFNTVEARNRLTGAVLDSYEQTLAQLQGQTQTAAGAQEPEQVDGPEEGPEFEEPGQSGPVMGMSQW